MITDDDNLVLIMRDPFTAAELAVARRWPSANGTDEVDARLTPFAQLMRSDELRQELPKMFERHTAGCDSWRCQVATSRGPLTAYDVYLHELWRVNGPAKVQLN